MVCRDREIKSVHQRARFPLSKTAGGQVDWQRDEKERDVLLLSSTQEPSPVLAFCTFEDGW